MNKIQLHRMESWVRDSIEINQRHKGCLFWNPDETEAHLNMKFEICKQLSKWKHEFYSEAIFTHGRGRADVIDASAGIIYEVKASESDESLALKKAKYPQEFELRIVDAKAKFNEKLLQ